MRRFANHALLCGAALAAFGLAQSAPAAEPSEKHVQIEEIIVTARKVREKSQEVPVAMTVFGAERIDSLMIRDISGISAMAPNLLLGRTDLTPAGAVIYMRGVGSPEIEKSQDAGVIVNQDGVDLGTMSGSALDAFDLESVEVLRGPQGTLFGRNTIGGSILVRRTRPTGEWGTKGSVTAGSFHRNDYKLVLNTPTIGEQLSFKFGYQGVNDNGAYRKQQIDPIPGVSLGTSGGRGPEVDRSNFLVTALYKPMADMDWLLTFERQRQRGDSALQQHLSQSEFACSLYGFCNFPDPDAGSIDNDWNGGMMLNVDATTLEGNWTLGPVTITSITAWRDTREDKTVDLDGSPAYVFHAERPEWYKQLSEELRASGELFDSRVQYVAGLYYWWSKYEAHATADIPPFGLTGPFATLQSGKQTNTAPAAFANVNVELIPDVNLTVGGRYTSEHKKFQGCAGNVTTGLTVCNGLVTGNLESETDSKSWRKFTPKVGLDWRPTRDALLFASWSTGFRSGGYNGRNAGADSIGPYDPETLSSFEIGAKTDWLDRRVRLNVSAFYNKYRNKQETVISLDPMLGTQTVIENAASAILQGYEIELTTLPVEGMMLGGSWAYIDSKYDEFVADLNGPLLPPGPIDNSDRSVSATPRYQIGAWASYTLPFMVGPGEVTLGAQYRFLDSIKSAVSEDPRADVPSVPILDASVRYDFELTRGRYHAVLFYHNLFNEQVVAGGVINPPLFAFAGQSPPRTWGLELGFEF